MHKTICMFCRSKINHLIMKWFNRQEKNPYMTWIYIGKRLYQKPTIFMASHLLVLFIFCHSTHSSLMWPGPRLSCDWPLAWCQPVPGAVAGVVAAVDPRLCWLTTGDGASWGDITPHGISGWFTWSDFLTGVCMLSPLASEHHVCVRC